MAKGFINTCLEALARTSDPQESATLIFVKASEILNRPSDAAVLARRVVEAPSEQEEAAQWLFSAVLDQARLARESHAPEGAAVFDAVETTLKDLIEADRLDPEVRMRLAQIYVQAGLEPPTAIMLRLEELDAIGNDPAAQEAAPDIGRLLDEAIREAGQEPREIHDVLGQLLAALPRPAQGALTAAVVSGDSPFATRLGTYWLLDRIPDVRLAVAQAFRDRAQEGRIDAAAVRRLVAVRKWLWAEPARAFVDEAVKVALRREIAEAAAPAQWTIRRVLASLPDGAGAQTVAAAVQRDRKSGLAMLLLKQGHGVKDAFILPCRSASEQKRMLDGIEAQTDAVDVDPSFVPRAIERALGDGEAAGVLPTPGLVDLAEIWSAEDLKPVASDPASMIGAIDTDNVLATLPVAKVARLVGQSRSWSSEFGLAQSWFETSADVRDLLERHETDRAAETALWRYLEGRRDWWATIFARTAAVFRAATKEAPDAWLSFAATAKALIEGRPLRNIPIIETIVLQTFAAEEARAFETLKADEQDDGSDSDDDMAALATPAGQPPMPEQPGEFSRLIEGSGLSPAWLDGHLAAVAMAPVFVSPMEWVEPLLQRIPFDDLVAVNRFLELLMARANAFVDPSGGPERVAAKLAGLDAAERRDWAAGFSTLVTSMKKAWPVRSLASDDKRILKSLSQAARAGLDEGLARLLPAWIERRYRLRG